MGSDGALGEFGVLEATMGFLCTATRGPRGLNGIPGAEPSWTVMGRSCGDFRAVQGRLGPSWGNFHKDLGAFRGKFWVVLGYNCGGMGAS